MLAVGLTVRVGIAAPRTTIAELRAIACCAAHCADTPRPPMRPHRCCFVDSGATDPATARPAQTVERPTVAPIALVTTVPAAAFGTPVLVACPLERHRAGPSVVLATQKLRC